jgi:hypothetical protein
MKEAIDIAIAEANEKNYNLCKHFLNEIEILKKNFTLYEINDLEKLQDLSTLQPGELILQSKNKYANVYKFTRKLNIQPRKQIATNLINIKYFFDYYINHKAIIEKITGIKFENCNNKKIIIDNIYLSVKENIASYGCIFCGIGSIIFLPMVSMNNPKPKI